MDLKKIRLYNIKRGVNYLRRCGIKNFLFKVIEKIEDNTDKFYDIEINSNKLKKQDVEYQENFKFKYEPKISIVVPVFNTPEVFLIDMIESVINQTYSNWELCIFDGGSNKDYIYKILNEYSFKDKRIKFKCLNTNKGISGNTNEALSLATGDFIGLLDHDDMLAQDAIFEVIKVINEKNTDIIYTDEDKISEDGKRRFEPHIKPDWSPDMLRSYNYICHFLVFKKELIKKVGIFREGFDGSQDYDFILRLTEATNNIVHIPKVLYHWRINENSTAYDITKKEYALLAGKKALEEHLVRSGIDGSVRYGDFLGSYKIKYNINEKFKVSIIVHNKNKNLEKLTEIINRALEKCNYDNYEIIIINNKANDIRDIKTKKNFKIITLHENNYSKIIEFGVENADGELIVLLDENVEIISLNWLESMVSYIQNKDTGIVGVKIIGENKRINNAGFTLTKKYGIRYIYYNTNRNYYGYMGRLKIAQNLTAVSSKCVIFKKNLFEEVDGFSDFLNKDLNFTDFCLKVRRLEKFIAWIPHIEVYDYNEYDTIENEERVLFENKWEKYISLKDCYFNLIK